MGLNVENIKKEISELKQRRQSLYVEVQDFRVDAIRTEKAMRAIQPITNKITKLEEQLRKNERVQNTEDFLKKKKEFLDK